MTILYDPPAGWLYDFPREYKPLPDETLAETLVRDGYPQRDADFGAKHCRFIGTSDELAALTGKDAA